MDSNSTTGLFTTGSVKNRVLRNTYALLALTLGVSAITTGISMALNLPHPGLLLPLL